jgi:hypothetical protein
MAIMYVRNAPKPSCAWSSPGLRCVANLSEWIIEAAQQRLEREGIDLPAEDEGEER